MGQELDLGSYLQILKRRSLFLIVPALAVFGAVTAFAYMLPPLYQATATVLVESQQIPTDLAQPTVTGGATERIKIIEQRLKARDNLLALARKHGLFADRPAELSPTAIVELTRAAIRIEPVGLGARGRADVVSFTVSFSYGEPNMAARVANELVGLILEQNIQSRTIRASQTSRFFEQRVSRLASDLAALEARIARFKSENEGDLPGAVARRQQEAELKTAIDNLDAEFTTLTAQREALINDPNATIVDVGAAQAERNKLRTQLVQLRAVYSDSHPEVRRLVAQIEAFDAAFATGDEPSDAGSATAANDQLAAVEKQIDALAKQRADLDERAAELRRTIERAPQVEVELATLNREYNSLQRQYADSQAKLAEAATGEQLEQERQAERFEVIDAAAVPTKPAQPNRRRIVLAGGFASIAAGLGMVLLVELLDKSIRSAFDLERRLQIRPISVIPYIATAAERSSRLRWRTGAVVACVAIVVSALALLQAFVLPLDGLAETILRRLGV